VLCGVQELIFSARRVCGSEALQLGLVDHCVEEGKAMERALELARDIAQVGSCTAAADAQRGASSCCVWARRQ